MPLQSSPEISLEKLHLLSGGGGGANPLKLAADVSIHATARLFRIKDRLVRYIILKEEENVPLPQNQGEKLVIYRAAMANAPRRGSSSTPSPPEDIRFLHREGQNHPPIPIFWSEHGSENVKYIGHWKAMQVKVKQYGVKMDKPRCAKIVLQLDRFDQDFDRIITYATTKDLRTLKRVEWISGQHVLATASREDEDDSSTDEEDSSDDEIERNRRLSARVASKPKPTQNSSSSEDSSDDEDAKLPAARVLRPKRKPGRPRKSASGGPPAKRPRGRPRKNQQPQYASSATDSSDDEEIGDQKQAARGCGRCNQGHHRHSNPHAESTTKQRGFLRKHSSNEKSPSDTPIVDISSSTARRVTPSRKTKRPDSTNSSSDKPLDDFSPIEVASLFDDKANEISALFDNDGVEEDGKEFRDLATSLKKRLLGGDVFAEQLEKGDEAFLKFLEDTLGLEGDKMFRFSVMDTFKKAM